MRVTGISKLGGFMMTSKSLFSGKNAWETTVGTSCEFTGQNEILPLFDHLLKFY